jgi:hypothetical protein
MQAVLVGNVMLRFINISLVKADDIQAYFKTLFPDNSAV